MKAMHWASLFKSYTIALLTSAAALALTSVMWPVLESNFFPFLLAIVMLVAWYSGRVPGLIAAVLIGVGSHLLLRAQDPAHPLASDTAGVVPLLTFALAALLISSLTAARRRAEAAERQQREWFEGTLSSLGEAVIATDLSGHVRYLNPIAQSFTGWSPAEAFAKPLAEVYQAIDEESNKSAISGVMKVLLTGVSVRPANHSVLVARDGTRRPVDYSASPLRNARGAVVGMVLVARDVTDARLAERKIKELKASLRRRVKVLQTILDVSPMGIAVAEDADCQRIWFNPALRKMLRLNADSSQPTNGNTDRPAYRIYRNGREIPEDQLPMRYSATHGVAVHDSELDYVLPDGTTFTVVNNVEPLFDDAGVLRGCLSFFIDINDRKRAEITLREAKEAAEAANQAKDRFLAILSHELRTPLTPVLLTVSSLLSDEREPCELRPTLEMIHRNVELEARLIDDLLDVMRIVRGKMPFHPEVVDAHALIRQTLEICRSDIHGVDLTLVVDLAASAHHVQADPARLQQVFWNLVKNAVKFTPTGGSLTVRSCNVPHPDASHAGSRLVVDFSDTGIGIDPEFLPKVFDAFEQGESSPLSRKRGGLGLGLAISQSVVAAQGGKLTAQSKGRNHGATFTLELDTVAAPAVPPSEQVRPAPDVRAARSIRILLVEDDPATLHAMSKLLGKLGYRVTSASTVASALKSAEEGEFDLVISDIGLPDGNGLELMRKLHAGRGVKGIALSGFGMDDDIRNSRDAGFIEHLTKPINFQTLEAAILSLAQSE